VGTFVEASKRLHWKPGKNPHNGANTAKIHRITVAELGARGPYWWTVPSLHANGDPAGARIIDGVIELTIWQDDEYYARCEAEEAESVARHWRAREEAARSGESAADHQDV
jgi:hypothetical protein